jgi:NAD(P)H-dependent FMN reductase
MTDALRIATLLGTTRPNRFGDKPASWIHELAGAREGVHAELIDLRDYPLPFYDQPVSPSRFQGQYPNETAGRLAKKIDEADAFIIVAPEYNHSIPAVLKNAMDWVYTEWNRKPAGFVSYGSVGGARGMQQLRLIAVELQMSPLRDAVHIAGDVYRVVAQAQPPVNPELFGTHARMQADRMLDHLVWWAKALKAARAA